MSRYKHLAWYSMEVNEVLKMFDSNPHGLSNEEAARRLKKFGPNELPTKKPTPKYIIFLRQFESPLIWILLIAAIIAFVAEEELDTIVITVVLVVNAIIGYSQEIRAQKAIEGLKKLSAPKAKVVRNGKIELIPAREVVPGDIIELEAGYTVPSDGRIIEERSLKISEGALTGESAPVEKTSRKLDAELSIADRINMVYASTLVEFGRGRAVVTATGAENEIGKIQISLQEVETTETPLQKRVGRLGADLGILAILLSITIVGLGFIRGFSLYELFFLAIAAAVSMIPEGLPAVLSVVLAIGVQRMAKRNAIIRKLAAVETLGSTTVICTDKTGTLTESKMTVRQIYASEKKYDFSGIGYEPKGEVTVQGTKIDLKEEKALRMLLISGILCNDSRLVKDKDEWKVIGDPTEGAIVVAAAKCGLEKSEISNEYKRIFEIPFDSEKKYMATLNEKKDGNSYIIHVKGAPEVILNFSQKVLTNEGYKYLDEKERKKILDENMRMAMKGLRVLGLAYKEIKKSENKRIDERELSGLVFLGLIGIIDPPRKDVLDAIKAAKDAKIRVVMITGDHKITAEAIGRELGIMEKEDKAYSGLELDKMTDEELDKNIEHATVFARVSPQHKLRIVKSLKKKGEVVAMTGDGVNDAPALKLADIGVSMGIVGTDVAKEASDMVLADDNFSTIVSAVEEGRVAYSNIKRTITYLISTNFGEGLTLITSILLGLPLPITALQILWVNLVTDGVSVIPLSLEPKHADVLNKPPRDPKEEILTKDVKIWIVMVSSLMACGVIGLFYIEIISKEPIERARSMAFVTLSVFQIFNVLNMRSLSSSIFKLGVFTNKYVILAMCTSFVLQLAVIYIPILNVAFNTVPLGAFDLFQILLVTSSILVAGELLKVVMVFKTRKIEIK
ncbi:MAG: HAD-IC family P-type ATPase [Thermoplasmata archaeon]